MNIDYNLSFMLVGVLHTLIFVPRRYYQVNFIENSPFFFFIMSQNNKLLFSAEHKTYL